MVTKDHSQITLVEAVEWTMQNCNFKDVRRRLKSRAVAHTLLTALHELLNEKEKQLFKKQYGELK